MYPSMKLATHMKNWQKSFFYCTAEVSEKENPLPGFRASRIVYHEVLNSYPSEEKKKKDGACAWKNKSTSRPWTRWYRPDPVLGRLANSASQHQGPAHV